MMKMIKVFVVPGMSGQWEKKYQNRKNLMRKEIKTVKYQLVLKKDSGMSFFQLHFPTTGVPIPILFTLSVVAFHTPFPS
jgi:hypothetical protein